MSSQSWVVGANGITCFDSGQREAVRAKLGIPDTAVLVGFVGRLDAQKAPHILVHAVPALLYAGGDVRVAIIADGPPKTEAEELARRTRPVRQSIWKLGTAPSREGLGQLVSISVVAVVLKKHKLNHTQSAIHI